MRSRLWLSGSAFLGLLLYPIATVAHETRMAFLDIRETAPREYTSALKVPMLGRSAWPIETRLPSQCEDTVAERRYERPGNLVIQRTFSCALDGPPPVLGLVGIDGGFVSSTSTLRLARLRSALSGACCDASASSALSRLGLAAVR